MTVAKGKKSKKPLTLRQVLNVIDTALARDDTASSKLWDVLTALRGPDDPEQYRQKETGTIYIRQAAFPKTAESVKEAGGYAHGAQYFRSKYYDYAPHSLVVPKETGHFNGHLRRAIAALELEPDVT